MPRDEGEVIAALRALPSGRRAIPRANARREAARAMRERGMTLAAIGQALGITRERVRQLTRGVEKPRRPRLRERDPDPRALEMLRAGESIEEVRRVTRHEHATLRAWRDRYGLAPFKRARSAANLRLDEIIAERFTNGRTAEYGEVTAIARDLGLNPQQVSNTLSCWRLYGTCDRRRAAALRALAKAEQSS